MALTLKRWIRPKISFLAFGQGKPVERKGEEKRREREKKKEEEKKRRREKQRMELCIEIVWNLHMYGLLV